MIGESLSVVDPKQEFMRIMEGALQFGSSVLMQNVGEELDAALNPILLKDFIVEGNRKYVKLGVLCCKKFFRLFDFVCRRKNC